jgi:hypothetical protein
MQPDKFVYQLPEDAEIVVTREGKVFLMLPDYETGFGMKEHEMTETVVGAASTQTTSAIASHFIRRPFKDERPRIPVTLPPMTHRLTDEAKYLRRTYIPYCLLCSRPFKHGDTRHIGYLADGRAIQVGDCCAHLLVETAVRYVGAVRPIETPASAKILWRYMDFSKYISMLATYTLYFSRIDHLNDPFEGAMGSEDNEEEWCTFYLSYFRDSMALLTS